MTGSFAIGACVTRSPEEDAGGNASEMPSGYLSGPGQDEVLTGRSLERGRARSGTRWTEAGCRFDGQE